MLDLKSRGPEFNSPLYASWICFQQSWIQHLHLLALLVNNQVVGLLPVGILLTLLFLIIFFELAVSLSLKGRGYLFIDLFIYCVVNCKQLTWLK